MKLARWLEYGTGMGAVPTQGARHTSSRHSSALSSGASLLGVVCLCIVAVSIRTAACEGQLSVQAGSALQQAPADRTLLLQQAHAARRSMLQAANHTRYQMPFNVCTSSWAPLVTCPDDISTEYDGFQVQLWREVAKDLGWVEDVDWSFSCMDWSDMMQDLLNPNGSCTMAAAAVEVSMTNVMAGLKFSWPIYKSGFQVMIVSTVETGGVWAFADAFHWSVWVMLGATAVAVSLLVTAAEIITHGDKANKKGMRGWTWYSMGKMVQIPTHVGDPKTWASRLLVLGYAFLVVIIVHLFTATTASKLTKMKLSNDIKGKNDLAGKKVETWEPYLPLLRKYGIDADALSWESDRDMHKMLDNLHSHTYQALVLDVPVIHYFTAVDDMCELYPVGEAFETFNLAIGYPPDVPIALASDISASIIRLQTTTAILDELEHQYMESGAWRNHATCPHAYSTEVFNGGHTVADTSISMQQVLGLWYILLITLGIALALTFVYNVRNNPRFRGKVATTLSLRWRDELVDDGAAGTGTPGTPFPGAASMANSEAAAAAAAAAAGEVMAQVATGGAAAAKGKNHVSLLSEEGGKSMAARGHLGAEYSQGQLLRQAPNLSAGQVVLLGTASSSGSKNPVTPRSVLKNTKAASGGGDTGGAAAGGGGAVPAVNVTAVQWVTNQRQQLDPTYTSNSGATTARQVSLLEDFE